MPRARRQEHSGAAAQALQILQGVDEAALVSDFLKRVRALNKQKAAIAKDIAAVKDDAKKKGLDVKTLMDLATMAEDPQKYQQHVSKLDRLQSYICLLGGKKRDATDLAADDTDTFVIDQVATAGAAASEQAPKRRRRHQEEAEEDVDESEGSEGENDE